MKKILEPHDPHFGVHLTHCCPGSCKYSQDDECPVSARVVKPMYECEDCTCEVFHPEVRFDRWWEGLQDQEKEKIHNEFCLTPKQTKDQK